MVNGLISNSEQTGIINAVNKHRKKISCGEALLKFTSEGTIDNSDEEAENFLKNDVHTMADFKENPRNAKI